MRILPKNYGEKQSLTLCRLLKFKTIDGKEYGITSLDVDFEFKGLVYKCAGNDVSTIMDDNEFTIANAETVSIIRLSGLTYKSLKSGILDNATWELYEVDYETLDYILLDKGMVGVVEVVQKEIMNIELLSLSNALTVPFGCVDSKRCRAIFGTEANSMFGCGVDASNMWTNGEVTGVDDSEPDVLFADKNIVLDTAKIQRAARVQFLTGNNASDFLYQVEAFSGTSGSILLMEATPYPIKIGDTFKIRPDCDKIPSTCKEYNNFINYKGEPFIPSQDAVAASLPFGQTTGGFIGGIDD